MWIPAAEHQKKIILLILEVKNILRKVREAEPNATSINLNGGIELTYNSDIGNNGAKVRVRLYASQVDEYGLICDQQFIDDKSVFISSASPHMKVHTSLRNIPINNNSSCSRTNVKDIVRMENRKCMNEWFRLVILRHHYLILTDVNH